MTPAELAAIRSNERTWSHCEECGQTYDDMRGASECSTKDLSSANHPTRALSICSGCIGGEPHAHAAWCPRADAAALLAEVERLTKENEELATSCAEQYDQIERAALVACNPSKAGLDSRQALVNVRDILSERPQ